MKLHTALFVSIALMASACSGSDSDTQNDSPTTTAPATTAQSTTTSVETTSTTTAAVVESADTTADLVAAIGSSFGDLGVPISAESEACIGEQTVAALGEDRLAEVGVTVDNAASFDPASLPDLSEPERDQLAAVLAECVDLRQYIATFYGDGDQALTSCSFELFSAEDGRDVIRAGMNPDTEAGFDAMFDIFGAADPCFVIDDQQALPIDSPEALAVAIATSFDDGTGEPTLTENQCAAEGIVTAFGVERLAEIGLTVAMADDFTPSDSAAMTDAERDLYLDAIGECLDLKQFVVAVFVNFDTACLDQMLTLDDARRFFRTFLAPVDDPSSETPPDVQAKFDACNL